MLDLLKIKKSAGVPVSRSTYRFIKQANAARAADNLDQAEMGYRAALRNHPRLQHIWVQLGHALKDGGKSSEAVEAYLRAIDLNPGDHDTRVHLAHVYKNNNQPGDAARTLLDVLEREPNHPMASKDVKLLFKTGQTGQLTRELLAVRGWQEAGSERSRFDDTLEICSETLRYIERGAAASDQERDLLSRTAKLIGSIREDLLAEQGLPSGPLFLDITILIDRWRSTSAPTSTDASDFAAIRELGMLARYRITPCFLDKSGHWKSLSWGRFWELMKLFNSDAATIDRNRELLNLQLHAGLENECAFTESSLLLVMGNCRSDHYLPSLRSLQAAKALKILNVLTQAGTPESQLRPWIDGIASLGGRILLSDDSLFAEVGARDGQPLDIHLIEEFVSPLDPTERELSSDRYVICTATGSTVREGELLLDVWSALAERLGDRTPRLIVISLSDDIETRLKALADSDLLERGLIQIVSQLSPEESRTLYGQALFAVQSCVGSGTNRWLRRALATGKTVAVLNPQCDIGDLAPFVAKPEAASPAPIAELLARLVTDDAYRTAMEQQVRRDYAQRPTVMLVDQIQRHLRELAAADAARTEPVTLSVGRWYRFEGPDTDAMAVRWGAGWGKVDISGAAVHPSGARLRFQLSERLPQGYGVYLAFECLGSRQGHYTATANTGVVHRGDVKPHSRRWVTFTIPESEALVDIEIIGSHREANFLDVESGTADLAVVGFYVADPSDLKAKASLLEAIALGTDPR